MAGRDLTAFNCKQCAQRLTRDEVAVTKKLINRGATEFMCAKCLADYYNVDESAVRERMEYFRSTGCTLFDKEP